MNQLLLMKKWLATFLFLAVSTFSWAYEFEINGIYYNTFGDNANYARVTYKTRYVASYSGVVTIPSSVRHNDKTYFVKEIGEEAFYGCKDLIYVDIPTGVTVIGQSAFWGCTNVASMTMPEGVTTIGHDAFNGCSTLTHVSIPNSVTFIDHQAFAACSSLTSLIMGSGVNYIGRWAFYGCSNLTSITVDKDNPTYDSREGCNSIIETASGNLIVGGGGDIILPEGVVSIGEDAFRERISLISITIPKTLTSIYYMAFAGCLNLVSINIDSNIIISKFNSQTNVKSIFGSQIKECFIGENVTNIGPYAFSGCSSLTKAEFSSIECLCNISFANSYSNPICVTKKLFIDKQEVKDVVIPENVTSIGKYAFYNCLSLKSVIIPNSVTKIGGYAFNNCSNLNSVIIPNSVTSIGSYAFSGCSGEAQINTNIPNGSSSTSSIFSPFYDAKFTKIVIGDGVTNIGDYAFYDCSNLISVKIPDGLTYIGDYAFYDCSNLISVKIPNGLKYIGSYAFKGCSMLTSPVTIPSSITNISDYAFEDCSSLTSVTISEGVITIGEFAFSGCSGLTSIIIPSSVTDISNLAFEGCSGKAFINCIIPNSVGLNYFTYAKFSEIFIGDDVTSIGSSAFYGDSDLKSVTIGNSVKSIGSSAFRNCSVLTSVTIGNSMTSIGDCAFDGCPVMTVTCQSESVPTAGSDSFTFNIRRRSSLYVPATMIDAYASVEPWSRFYYILPIDPSAVEDLNASNASNDENAPIYDLNGRKLTEKPKSGFYIQGGRKYLVQ